MKAASASRAAPLPRQPLYQQVLSHLLVPFVVAFLLAAGATVLVGYQVELAKQRAEQQEILELYGRSLLKPLWDCDTATSQSIVNALAYHQAVARAQLEDLCSSSTIAIETTEHDADVLPPVIRNLIYRDELGRQHVVGVLTTQFRKVSIAAATMEVLWRYLVIFVVILGVTLVGTLLVFRKIVGRPLRQFQAAIATGIHADGGAAPVPALPAEQRNDELGDVMHAYNGLMTELNARYKRQQTLAQCARELLATAPDNIPQLRDVLDRVRATVAADRLYLAEHEAGADGRLQLRYTAVVGTPLPPQAAYRYSRYCERAPRWEINLKQRLPLVADAADRPLLDSRNAQSLAAFPVWGQSNWYGYIGAEDLARERTWSESEMTFLQTIADMIGAFLENRHHSQQLAGAIDKLQANEKILLQLARRDPLTGLGNRTALDEALQHAVHRAQRTGIPGYVLLIDLNRFKPINDTLGHPVGDQVLQEVAHRLQRVTRQTDTVARLGGDEFVVIAEGLSEPIEITVLMSKLEAVISEPQRHGGYFLVVGASIGAACFPLDGTSSRELLAHADKAMYAHKQRDVRGEAVAADPAVLEAHPPSHEDAERGLVRDAI